MTPYRRVMAEKRRLIWPIVIGLLLNLVLFGLVVYPLSNKVAAGEQEAEAAALSLAASTTRNCSWSSIPRARPTR